MLVKRASVSVLLQRWCICLNYPNKGLQDPRMPSRFNLVLETQAPVADTGFVFAKKNGLDHTNNYSFTLRIKYVPDQSVQNKQFISS